VKDQVSQIAQGLNRSKQPPFTLGEPVFRDVLANGFSRYWASSARTFDAFLRHFKPSRGGISADAEHAEPARIRRRARLHGHRLILIPVMWL
jgi:hypothetical protein